MAARLRLYISRIIAGVCVMGLFHCNGTEAEDIRKPAVAGQFYSSNPKEVREFISSAFEKAKEAPCSPTLLLSPHAGYPFSGELAALGYAALEPGIRRVFILGPAHHYPVDGISIPDVDAYHTPLGNVSLDKDVISQLRNDPLVSSSPNAHAQEHSIEVQLPFLQMRLDEFTFIPMLMRDAPAEKVARLIKPYIDERTVVVASSDLSHFHSYEEANRIDSQSIEAILSGNTDASIEACGETGIKVLIHLAGQLNLQPIMRAALNSHDAAPEYAPKDRVVGYTSIIYCPEQRGANTASAVAHSDNFSSEEVNGSAHTPDEPMSFSDSAKQYMLRLARQSIAASLRDESPPSCDDAPQELKKARGCFVTLTSQGALRGCIGNIQPVKPIFQAIKENAQHAAFNDHRFSPVTKAELDGISIEISVLTKPEPIEYRDAKDLLDKIVKGKDGIILSRGMHRSTYLPQVWEQLNDKKEFLRNLSHKAGLPRDAWKTADIQRYRVIHFSESGK